MDFALTAAHDGLQRSAEFSECGRYRWSLRRSWRSGGDGRTICFVLLNASTADGMSDDQTSHAGIRFTKKWGYSCLIFRNLYPFIATEPRDMWRAEAAGVDITGGYLGDKELHAAAEEDTLVCAWGAHARPDRVAMALEIFRGKSLWCLGTNADGSPRHPLYLKHSTQLQAFNQEAF